MNPAFYETPPGTPDVVSNSSQAAGLRRAMVAQLEARWVIRNPRIAAATRRVPRHVFVPDVPLNYAYRDEVVPVKYQESKAVITLSQPSAIATMLEQLQVEPGMHVLEVGAGTGYNAALLAELAEGDRLVATIDIDVDLIKNARGVLDAAGYPGVRVITADGFRGAQELAPFDRIELSVATRVISPHLVDQVVDGGLLVGPLHIKGLPFLTPSFRKQGNQLMSESIRVRSFVPLRGEAATTTPTFRLPVRPELRFVWEANDEFPAGLLTRILRDNSRSRGEIPVSWAAATYLLLTDEDAFYAETGDQRMRWIALVDRASESLAAIISSADGWGATAVVTYGPDDAYKRMQRRIEVWVRAVRPGTEALRLTAVPSGEGVKPEQHRARKPFFDVIASYNDSH